jgi:hypothetical protein
MGDVQSMIMVNPIATLTANLLAMPKVCLLKWAIAGEGIRCKFVAIVIEHYRGSKAHR